MDFDTLINIVILVLFFVLPAVLNRFKKKARKASAATAKKKTGKPKSLIFGNISDQIQKFLKDLEQQARQQEQSADKTVWDELAREPGYEDEDVSEEDVRLPEGWDKPPVEKAPEPWKPAPYAAAESERHGRQARVKPKRYRPSPPPLADCQAKARARNRACRLRRAVVWSEILGKPVALKRGVKP